MHSIETYFLFPFKHVKPGEKVLIYGAGRAGQMYMRQVMASNYCELVGFLDKKADEYQLLPCNVWAPEILLKMEADDYDVVVISVQKKELHDEIKEELHRACGLPYEKVILPLEHGEISTENILPVKQKDLVGVTAFERSKVPIALIFRTGGGLGDAVIALKLMEAILSLAPDALVDIFVQDELQKEYAEVFYTGLPGLGSIQPMEAYLFHRERYVLSIKRDRFVDIDYMNEKALNLQCQKLLDAMLKVKKDNKLYFRHDTALNSRNYTLSHILGTNCYTCLGGGALPINDNKVYIRLWPEYEEKFKKLDLKCYITFNCGSGGIMPGRRQIKEWPSDYMERYLEIVKGHFPGLEIIQLGSKEMTPLPQADRHYLGYELRLVEHILANSLMHIDIEGGLVHLATQLGTKCAVVFGPTDPAHFAYETNINLSSDICVPCFGVRLDVYHCLRGEDERPPCMCAVKPEDVWERTREWLEKSIRKCCSTEKTVDIAYTRV